MFDEIGIGRGRPRKGRGAKQISVTVERDLQNRVEFVTCLDFFSLPLSL